MQYCEGRFSNNIYEVPSTDNINIFDSIIPFIEIRQMNYSGLEYWYLWFVLQTTFWSNISLVPYEKPINWKTMLTELG